jgi:hypothetical protein
MMKRLKFYFLLSALCAREDGIAQDFLAADAGKERKSVSPQREEALEANRNYPVEKKTVKKNAIPHRVYRLSIRPINV